MKKLVKILPVVLMLVMAVSAFAPVLAVTDPSTLTGTDTQAFDGKGNAVIGFVQAIGSIISVVILIVIGIKYMMGSAEEKAEYKKTLLPYLIGAILIFAASNIAGMIYGFAKTF